MTVKADRTRESPDLALGTVQFGCAYGIAGAGQRVSESDARTILSMAHERGVRMLDTSPTYGDIEQRLVDLFPRDAEFAVTSKLASLPSEYLRAGADAAEVSHYVASRIEHSASRLDGRLETVLFHRPADLKSPMGRTIWEAAWETTRAISVRLGISVYEVQDLPDCAEPSTIEVVQAPANIFDQRLFEPVVLRVLPREVHVRSAFLQGLLLMDEEEAIRRFPIAETALRRWHRWREVHSLDALRGALGFVKSLSVRYCIVGVDSPRQFAQVADAWAAACPFRASELAVTDIHVIDPRTWA